MANELYEGDAVRNINLGLRVEKTAISLADIDLFTITGECLITLMYGIVTGVGDGGATTIALNEKASSIAIMAATTVTSDAVGEVYLVTGQPNALANGGIAPTLKIAGATAEHDSATDRSPVVSPWIFDGQDGLILELTQTGADATHAVKWVIFYIPLEDGASIVAA
jgi:hypothetical protein